MRPPGVGDRRGAAGGAGAVGAGCPAAFNLGLW